MATREEIRDTIIANITKSCPTKLNWTIVELTDKILKDEHSQGVVIKVDKPLPFTDSYGTCMAEINALNILVEAGYCAVESLIE